MLYDVEVAVVGLGLMGSSLAAAMRSRGLVRRVVGVARRTQTARRALELGAGDETTTSLDRIRTSDVVILSTPVRTILNLLPDVARIVSPAALVTDVGSTKTEVMRAAEAAGLRFAGGHPMAGSERSGVEACDPNLYKGFPWILIRGEHAQERDCELLEALVAGVGARPVWMDTPERHDRLVAQISHVPYLLAYALLDAAEDDARALAGNSYRDATRVAAGPVEMIMDFLRTNRGAIEEAVGRLLEALEALRTELRAEDESALRARLESLARRRREQP
jgi:prephenate dehydrogenase